jgi:beta-lactamase regulating signal transducer with metallopeptidase domain
MAWVAEVAGALLRVAGWEVFYSSILFVIVLALTRVLRNVSPLLRHALWGLVLLRLILPIDLSVPFSLWNLVGRTDVALSTETLLQDAWWAGGWSDAGGMVEGSASATGDAQQGSAPWLWMIVVAWVVGMLAVGCSVIRKRRVYRKIVRRARPVDDVKVLTVARHWTERFRVRRAVRVVTSDDFGSPFTYGSMRPVVFLPRAVMESDQVGLVESVLAHELAHVGRWDDLLLEIQLLISVMYFFNPVVWVSSRRMRDESERICDGMVLGSGGISAKTYGRSILTVLRLGVASEPGLIPALVSTKERLEMRLKSIKKGSSVKRASIVYSLPVVAAFGLFLLPMATGSMGQSNAEVADAATWDSPQEVVLVNPMPGARVTSAWRLRPNPYTGEEAHHRGIDLVDKAGSAVHAAADGVVEVATADYAGGKNHGTVIIIDHSGGLKTFYSHLDEMAVQVGDRVIAGDRIGTQGSTGKVTGPHLHFEVWERGEYVDPARFVADWPLSRESFRI